MSKIGEILNEKLGYSVTPEQWDIIVIAMEEYAEFKLNEFKNSDRFSKLLEDSEWLYYLNCAGVDNWEGYSVAHDLKKEDSE